MPDETSKALDRRLTIPAFRDTYMRGDAIDIGAGGDGLSKQRSLWPHLTSVRDWDIPDGDAQLLEGVPDDAYDLVHSSHCLEHVRNPYEALAHWVRVCKPGGHVVVLVPEEDLYEQGVFPSTFNGDHKSTFTMCKRRSWSPVSVSIVALLVHLGDMVECLKAERLEEYYNWSLPRVDQTQGPAPCAIEVILRKRTPRELLFGGRVGKARYD